MEVILPPPEPNTYKKGLMKLFSACGLADVILDGDPNCEGSESKPEASSLSKFLPWATEQIRLHVASKTDPGLKIANLRGALRLGRNVLVSFPSLCEIDAERRVMLLHSLVAVLESRPHLDLQGCHILIGSAPTGIDRLGHLCLNQDDASDDWLALLQEESLL